MGEGVRTISSQDYLGLVLLGCTKDHFKERSSAEVLGKNLERASFKLCLEPGLTLPKCYS